MEHVRDLKPALRRLCDVLADDGMLYVQVPDASRFAGRDDAPYQEFSTEHINFFSAASLANLLRKLGFQARLCEENAYEQDQGAPMPLVDAVFQRVSQAALPLERDDVAEPGLNLLHTRRAKSRRTRPADDRRNSRARRSDHRLGSGHAHAAAVSTSRLKDAKIAAFVDSNPHYQGKTLQGAPILAPAALRNMPQAILISSQAFQRNIEDQIRNVLKLDNRIHLLYDA